MILSNEPGYYKTGAYGIRIENLVLVETARDRRRARSEMLGFETLTFAPIDRRLIDAGAARRRTSAPGSTPTTPGCARC